MTMPAITVISNSMQGGEQRIRFLAPDHLIQVIKVEATEKGVGVGAFLCVGEVAQAAAALRIEAYDFSGSDSKIYELKSGYSLWFGGGSPGDHAHAPSTSAFRATLVELKDPTHQVPVVTVTQALATGTIPANSKGTIFRGAGLTAVVIVDKPCRIQGTGAQIEANVPTGAPADTSSGAVVLETNDAVAWSLVQVVR